MSSDAITCIQSLSGADFNIGLFTVPQGLTSIPFRFSASGSCYNNQAYKNVFPVDATFAAVAGSGAGSLSVSCGSVTANEALGGGSFLIDCPITSNSLRSNTQYDVSFVSETDASLMSNSASAYINVLPADQACLQLTSIGPPSSASYVDRLSRSDQGYLTFPIIFSGLSCFATASEALALTLVDPLGVSHTYTLDLTKNAPTGPFSPTDTSRSQVTTQDFGLPVNGLLLDGDYILTLNVAGSPPSESPPQTGFAVGHTTPLPTGGLGRRRGIASRWNRYVNHGDASPEKQQQQQRQAPIAASDSSFYFKATDSCAYTNCPVPGQLGVFECIDTQTNLDSCGGCPSSGAGHACSEIANAAEMACVAGKCMVSSCDPGWIVAANSSLCLPLD